MSDESIHIVVLEDNEPDLIMVKKALREAGVDCRITAFTDGAEALTYIQSTTSLIPDLVILDFNVPKVAGASVLNTIRGNTRWNRVGVFMFTASQDPADRARIKMLGADEYLIKPMDMAGFSRFGEFVKEWLAANREQRKGEVAH